MSDTGTRCWYCDRHCADSVCDSPRCRMIEREVLADLRRTQRADLISAVRASLAERCKESGWQLTRGERWFYTAKLMLCVLIGRTRPSGKHLGVDSITVGHHHFAKLYAGWESRWIEVGHGVLCNWWYSLESDGEWDM